MDKELMLTKLKKLEKKKLEKKMREFREELIVAIDSLDYPKQSELYDKINNHRYLIYKLTQELK